MAWKENQNAEESVEENCEFGYKGCPVPKEQFSDLVEFYVS